MAPNPLANLSSNAIWHLLVDAAKQALAENGYALHRIPGRGLSNVWLYHRQRQARQLLDPHLAQPVVRLSAA